jgi:filamentous hemagglutinin
VLVAPEGNIHVRAQSVQIDAATDRGESTQSSESSRTAIGGSVSIPVVDALRAAHSARKAGEETRSDRMKAMAAINAGLALKDAAKVMQNGVNAGIKISVNVSNSESYSEFSQSGTNAVGSTVAAAGDLSIEATGAGTDSNLTILGSDISAGEKPSSRSMATCVSRPPRTPRGIAGVDPLLQQASYAPRHRPKAAHLSPSRLT